VKVGTDDPCMSFEVGGRKWRTKGQVAEMPAELAAQFDQGSGAPFGVLRGVTLGVGWGEGTCDTALKQAERRHGSG
jgi:hypothetical protein